MKPSIEGQHAERSWPGKLVLPQGMWETAGRATVGSVMAYKQKKLSDNRCLMKPVQHCIHAQCDCLRKSLSILHSMVESPEVACQDSHHQPVMENANLFALTVNKQDPLEQHHHELDQEQKLSRGCTSVFTSWRI